MKRLLIALVALVVSACGPVNAIVPAATPNVVAGGKANKQYELKVSGIAEGETCSKEGGLRDLCVTQLRQSVDGGLKDVLSGYMDQGEGGYTAEFKVLQFKHTAASGMVAGPGVVGMPSVQVSLRWQFVLRDEGGAPVVQLAETTVGPNRFMHVDAAGDAIGALVNTTLETIADALNKSQFWAPGTSLPEAEAK